MPPTIMTVMFSESAAGSSSGASSLGRIALRAGWFTAKNACCTANRLSRSQTLVSLNAACSQNRMLVAMGPTVVTTSSVRRSATSASAPPQRPKTTRGTRPNTPANPTYADEPVAA